MALDLGDIVGYLKLDDTDFGSVLDRLPDKLKGKGALLAGGAAIVGGLAIGALVQGMNSAMDFEQTNNMIAGQLGLTAVESARVGTLAGSVYAQNYGESVEQVQSTIGGVITQIDGMASASDTAVEGMTAKVLNYASAFGGETSDAIAMVQQLMTSGLAGSADEAMDLMTKAMQTVPEALRGDMSDAITEYGPLLADMGFSGEEAFGILAKGAERGMYGIDKAGDSLKEFGIRSTDMSAASKVAYDAMGMDQQDYTNRLLAGGDTARGAFDEIVNGLKGIEDPAAQSQAALALFGTPLEDLGVTEIPGFLDSLGDMKSGMGDAAGAAEEMGDTIGAGAANGIETMSRQWEIMTSQIGSVVLPVLTAVMDFLNSNPAVFQLVAGAIGILAVAFVGLTVATWAMNTALLANPITWLVIAIVALIAAVVLLVMHWDEVVAGITGLWEGFVSWFTGVMDGFISWWNEVWAGFGSWITSVWEGFVSWITEIWLGFATWLVGIVDGIVSWWNGVWTAVGDFLGNAWNTMIAFVTAVLIGYYSWLTGIISGLVSWWNGVWSGVSSFLADIWNNMMSFLSGIVGSIVSFLTARFTAVGAFLSGIWNGVWTAVSTAFNNVLSFLGGIPGQIMGFFSGIGSWLWQAGADLIQGLLDGIASLAGTVGSFFLNLLPAWIVEPFKAALGIHSPSRLFGEFGKNTVEGYLNMVHKMRPAVQKELGGLIDTPSLTMSQARTEAVLARSGAVPANGERTLIYNAAENQSLSAEEALFDALGSPRAKD